MRSATASKCYFGMAAGCGCVPSDWRKGVSPGRGMSRATRRVCVARNLWRCSQDWKCGISQVGTGAKIFLENNLISFEHFDRGEDQITELMSAATPIVPEITSVEQARGVVTDLVNQLQRAQWRVTQLEKQLYGPSSERKAPESTLSKERVLLSHFPAPAEAPATQQVVVAPTEGPEPRARRQFAIKAVETVTERLEPQE